MVATRSDVRERRLHQTEAEILVVEDGRVAEHEPGQRPEASTDGVEKVPRHVELSLQTRVDVFVEVLEQHAPRVGHPLLDGGVHLGTQPIERRLDLLGTPTLLVDLEDAPLEVDPRLDGAEHLV